MDLAKLRAWWSHRQGLDGSLPGQTSGTILARCGWARSVGGVGPYLTLFARGGVSRETADAAVANLEIHELPAVRGCTYVVPATDFALALLLGQSFAGNEMKVARKLGVTDREVDQLGEKVLRAIENGPLGPDEIKDALGGAVRNLGEEGKKKGVTTTLPLALGRLQSAGEIRRVPVNGRLDQQRYRYALWRPNPLRDFKLSLEEANVELARRFFSWIGPASIGEFQWTSGLGVKAAKAAMEPLKLEPISGDGDRFLLPQDRAAFEAFQTPAREHFTLVSSLDSISLLRRDSLGPAGQKGGLQSPDLPSHAIMDRGNLAGLWEYDPEEGSIAWMAFGTRNAAMTKAVKLTEEYVRTQLGDARSFSLDSPKSRVPKIAALKVGKIPAV